ncbi:MAG: hypothetical protein ACFFDF_13925 [Candidatus Odinarchaeota archaeon]
MRIRNYLWILSITGAILIIISILTPTSYNDTNPTLYYVWMTQVAIEVQPFDIYVLRTDLTLDLVSWVLFLAILSSALIALTLNITYVRNSLNFKKLRWKMILIAGIVIVSTLFWILMMEFFYNVSGFHHWIYTGGGYTPYFGVIGPFIGATLLIIGVFTRRD